MGFCPIGKFVFSHEDALRYKRLIGEKLSKWDIECVGIDDAVEDGIVRSVEHVEPVVRHLRARDVDGIFMPHCNFGTEHAAGLIGREMGVPVLLWGPRDEAPLPDGTRLRDSLCGLLASSKVLGSLGVAFTYIGNCRLDDPAFEQGLKDFQRVVSVVKGFRGMRIGLIGQRVDFFWTTIINEGELLDRFGIEVLPLDMMEVVRDVQARADRDGAMYREELRVLSRQVRFEGFADESPLVNVLALRDQMLELAQERGLSGFAVQSFMSICEQLGAMVEFAMAEVSESGYPAACESDIHGAVSCVMLQRASLETEPTFLADFTVRHPEDDNGVLLWHCGFPLGLRKPDAPASLGTHWILPGIPPGSCHWQLKDGEITVARFDGDRGEYRLAAGEGHTIEGPYTQNVYAWMRVDDWPRWERQLIEGPYIHHTGAAYGRHASVLMEACKYIPGLTGEPLGRNAGNE
ncbi:MAG: fucose isomerase [Candidatus Brocadiae bacterium]|nr:fucose isomerase [Candidatus Brocadiia bacterium]